MLIKYIILAFIGIICGFAVSGGIFAFITMIGIVPRFASRTGTASRILLYEDMVLVGGICGNLTALFQPPLPFGIIGLGAIGLFSGVFVGCLAMALAEVLQVIPIFARRVHLTQGLPFVIVAIALGKMAGSFYQLFIK